MKKINLTKKDILKIFIIILATVGVLTTFTTRVKADSGFDSSYDGGSSSSSSSDSWSSSDGSGGGTAPPAVSFIIFTGFYSLGLYLWKSSIKFTKGDKEAKKTFWTWFIS